MDNKIIIIIIVIALAAGAYYFFVHKGYKYGFAATSSYTNYYNEQEDKQHNYVRWMTIGTDLMRKLQNEHKSSADYEKVSHIVSTLMYNQDALTPAIKTCLTNIAHKYRWDYIIDQLIVFN